MTTAKRESIYERLRPHLNAEDLIARLGIEHVRTLGSEAYCKPLCHESSSGESLQINTHTGRWNCKACQHSGVYGDLVQLVEYVQTGGQPPHRGPDQGRSETHRAALAWLCQQYGLPFDERQVRSDAGLDVVHMVAMQAHENLLADEETLAWVQEKWGFDRATVEQYGLGYLPTPLLPSVLNEAARPEARGAFKSSGLGWYGANNWWHTRFEGRVTFPYLEHGKAVYLIGRATPWTPAPEAGRQAPKYHKLSVHSEQRPWISESVTNDHLYNEPVMSSASEIGIVEGVADAVALSALGVPVVSPVTINFNAADEERFLRKCKDNEIKSVWILFDNELSGSGNWGARRTALKLIRGGLCVKIVTLPLGPEQRAARDEVLAKLGADRFEELERSDPRERSLIIAEAGEAWTKEEHEWIEAQIEATKIDAAEWCAQVGAGAAGKFDTLRRDGQDVIALEIADVEVDEDAGAVERIGAFGEVIKLIAHVDESLMRQEYSGLVAAAAGKGVSKAEVNKRVSRYRKEVLQPERKEAERKMKASAAELERGLVVLPPDQGHAQPAAPTAPEQPQLQDDRPDAPAAPSAPKPPELTEHERYRTCREAVARAIEGKLSEEAVGQYVAQTILESMGFTAFRTADDLYLIRGNERVPMGRNSPTQLFSDLLYVSGGLTNRKTSHRAYIAAVMYFLGKDARRVLDVSWSHVNDEGVVHFPLGDTFGRILRISPGEVELMRMAELQVPAVAGAEFQPIEYVESGGGIDEALRVFEWVSLSRGDRMLLIYWLVCLPILRRVGTIPIVRIEGGSASGKTRAVDAVSFLVNGQKSSSVPTASALTSRLSANMLTIDDNRESGDVSPSFLGTMLQATNLGAREKRRANTDTGTVVERVCGALLMNGIEPIHDGKSELASRILTLRAARGYRAPDSPSSEAKLAAGIRSCRSAFWSDAARRCAAALALDEVHGEALGEEIEELFGSTKIGRLAAYLRLMYLAWVAGIPDEERQAIALTELAGPWREAFGRVAGGSLSSLLAEELSVTALRYVFAYGIENARPAYDGASTMRSFDGKLTLDPEAGLAYLGPLSARHLARLVRLAAKEMNGPQALSGSLRAGQLEERLVDGRGFIEADGMAVVIETTGRGRRRFSFSRPLKDSEGPGTPPRPEEGWTP